MGSGKSMATRRYGERIAASGLQVAAYTEAADPHPVRVFDDLADPFQPWNCISASALGLRVRQKWERFVEARLADRAFTVMDGQLFHGDLTNLFMMEMARPDIGAHTAALLRVLRPLEPTVIYFHQRDVGQAMRTVFEARGPKWEAYQLGWKLRSPYATRRQFAGLGGLTSMYEDYRSLTDTLFEALDCRKLAVETGAGDWPAYYAQVDEVLRQAQVPI
jgi:hypothetical protein